MYVYIDSNVIVSAEIESESNYDQSKAFMKVAQAVHSSYSDVEFFTSIFTFLELASAMIRRTSSEERVYSLLYRIRTSWKSWIKPVAPLAPKELTSFQRLVDSFIETAVKFGTPTADTIHAQTVRMYNFDFLVTWNKKDFKGMLKEMKKLEILTPYEMQKRLRYLSRGRSEKSFPPGVAFMLTRERWH